MNRIRVVPREGLKQESYFKMAVQLSRLINNIQANKRHYIRIRDDADPTVLRDRIELILYHGAIVFEAIQTMMKSSGQLCKLRAWAKYNDLVRRIQNEANDQQSFTNKYLKPIRNKVTFHYDMEAIDAILSTFPITDATSFAESETKLDREIAFILADEILINFAISTITERNNEESRWEYFQEALLEVSDILVELLLRLTVELAKDFTIIEESGG